MNRTVTQPTLFVTDTNGDSDMLKSALAALLFLASVGVALADDTWIGTWKSDWNGVINTTLVVKSASSNGAKVKYSWVKTVHGPAGSVNLSAKLSGKKLTWSTNGIRFVFTHEGQTLAAIRTTSQGSAHGTFRKIN